MEWVQAFFATFSNMGMSSTCAEGTTSKLESRSKVCYFVGYPKETKGWYFYHPREQKMFVSTNAVFLEDNYILNYKPKGMIVLEEVKSNPPFPKQLMKI